MASPNFSEQDLELMIAIIKQFGLENLNHERLMQDLDLNSLQQVDDRLDQWKNKILEASSDSEDSEDSEGEDESSDDAASDDSSEYPGSAGEEDDDEELRAQPFGNGGVYYVKPPIRMGWVKVHKPTFVINEEIKHTEGDIVEAEGMSDEKK